MLEVILSVCAAAIATGITALLVNMVILAIWFYKGE